MKKENYIGKYLVTSFSIQGPLRITPPVFGDDRGFFTERFRLQEFSEMGIPAMVQENYSRSQANVLRGLHYQFDQPQGKLVTATRGKILDVAVDIRVQSPTFGQHLSVILDGAKPEWFWIPPGFAHGFLVISDEGADVLYKVNNVYNPAGEGAIRWDDSNLGIDWLDSLGGGATVGPQKSPVLSAKDLVAPAWEDYKKAPRF
jgi:dTDP-4-dehydrorhamnose 3,5-epimerase